MMLLQARRRSSRTEQAAASGRKLSWLRSRGRAWRLTGSRPWRERRHGLVPRSHMPPRCAYSGLRCIILWCQTPCWNMI
jgi:hypothetical protein